MRRRLVLVIAAVLSEASTTAGSLPSCIGPPLPLSPLSTQFLTAMTTPANTPFHAGELEVQIRAGTEKSADYLGRHMIHESFAGAGDAVANVGSLPYLVVGAVDSASEPPLLWTTMLAGSPGGVASIPDTSTLRLAQLPALDDPARTLLQRPGTLVGALATDLATRNRLRINSVVRRPTRTGGVDLQVVERFGNCPKYIFARSVDFELENTAPSEQQQPVSTAPEVAAALSQAQQQWVQEQDTFFITTYHDTKGADTSHRGGNPGFVRVDSLTHLWWPDYQGNGMFNTLGNICATGRAGLFFMDFATGDSLQVAGRAWVEWRDEPEATRKSGLPKIDGSNRIVHLEIEAVVARRTHLPFRFDFDDHGASPFNPNLTGDVRGTAANATSAIQLPVTVVSISEVTSHVKTFSFRVDSRAAAQSAKHAALSTRLATHFPGEYVTFQLTNSIRPKGGDEVVRSWTIVSQPSSLNVPSPASGQFSISVKRESQGLASQWLHKTLAVGDQLLVSGVGGGGTMSFFMSWPTGVLGAVSRGDATLGHDDLAEIFRNVVYSRIAVFTAGIGITPVMANLRSLTQLLQQAVDAGVAVAKPEIRIVHSSRTWAEVPFKQELRDLCQTGVISHLTIAITSPDPAALSSNIDWAATRKGRVDEGLVDKTLPVDRVVSVFLCGPQGFMESTRSAMFDLGLPSGFLHEEAFYF
eukprot:m.53710 g.53710  ORF g.53710 m.53710 type:complete len:698 (+) comp12407_c0_seq1:206-2299(+)